MEQHVEVHGNGRRDGRSDIVAQTIIANPFRASRGGKGIDGECAVRNGCGSEWSTVQGSNHGKNENRRCQEIASEEEGKQTIHQHQHFLSRKTIHDVAAERTNDESGDGVARKYQSNGLFISHEPFAHEDGEERHEHIEREKQKEISNIQLDEVAIP